MEILAVVVIIGIAGAAMASGARSISRSNEINRATTQLARDIELLQSRASSAKKIVRITRTPTGYECASDDDTSSSLNVTRTFENVAWADENEFEEIVFQCSATPRRDDGSIVTNADNDLVIEIPDYKKTTIRISPVIGAVEIL